MIETTGLTRAFGGRRAIDDVTMALPTGSVTALLGLNGAGKTTLLRLIAGLDRPEEGTVTVCGRRPCGDPRLVGMHLGPGAGNPRHTVRRHVNWLAALAGVTCTRADDALAAAGLCAARAEPLGCLSLGARQRLAIAGALLCEPRALLLDEPLNGLDVSGIVWLRQLLRQLAATGCTVVLATHMLGEAVLTADHIAVIDGGQLRMAGPKAGVIPAGTDAQRWLESTLTECA